MRIQVALTIMAVALALAVPAAAADAPSEATESGVVAYYFHGNVRCKTCRTLEAHSEEAIAKGFADELEAGRLQWRVVNTDESGNAHFVKDFELVTKALVLVEYEDGKVTRFKDLKLIWQLVRDKEGFLKYVRDQTAEFLGEA